MCTFSFVCTKIRCALKTPVVLSGGIYVYLRIFWGGGSECNIWSIVRDPHSSDFSFFNLELRTIFIRLGTIFSGSVGRDHCAEQILVHPVIFV